MRSPWKIMAPAAALLALAACSDMGWGTRNDGTPAGASGSSGATAGGSPGAGTTTGNDAISRNRAPSSSRQPGGATSGESWRPMDSDAPGAN